MANNIFIQEEKSILRLSFKPGLAFPAFGQPDLEGGYGVMENSPLKTHTMDVISYLFPDLSVLNTRIAH